MVIPPLLCRQSFVCYPAGRTTTAVGPPQPANRADNLVSVSRKPVILEDTISGRLQLSNETKEVYCIARIYVSKIHSCTNIDDSRNYTTSALIKIELNLEGTTSNTATAATATSATEKPITVLQNATENNQSTSNPTSTTEPDFIKDLEKKEFPTIIVIISTAAILVLFLLLTFIYCCCRKRCKRNIEIAKPEESTKRETAQDAIYAIPETVTYATLQLATSSNQVLSNKDVTQYAEVIGQLVPKKKYKI
ncbi:uncharacterized protein LOC113226321 [Hyposmocoma kahamanoa]|uniref:uncharacterized protein LOC113226321 n=1 Tax=Hyposmocoma kahamanoa TaxID=1477025 RepID=UPI000E6D804C|nr:uncharacterized protein LOC113226321 [Hyposmocoma kahamanoa]